MTRHLLAIDQGTTGSTVLIMDVEGRTLGDLLADAAYLPLTSVVIAGMRSLTAAAGVWVAGWISGRYGLSLWPHSWPLLAQRVVSVAVATMPLRMVRSRFSMGTA